MTSLESLILADLAVSQSTAAAIADRQRIQPQAAEIILKRLQAQNQVTSFELGTTGLTVWKLLPL